jgi:hypothetical protein
VTDLYHRGDQLTVRRYLQTVSGPMAPGRMLMFEFTATVTESDVDPQGVNIHFDPETVVITYDDWGQRSRKHLRFIRMAPARLDSLHTWTEAELTPERGMPPFRTELAPCAWLELDGSGCIVLEVGHPGQGIPPTRVTVTNVDAWKSALDNARTFQAIRESMDDRARRQ